MIVFFVMAASPADPLDSVMPKDGMVLGESRVEQEKIARVKYGLDKPAYIRYLRWLNLISPVGFEANSTSGQFTGSFGFKAPDLGKSLTYKRPVVDVIKEALPITVLMNLVTVPFMYIMSINLGIFSAKRKGQWSDLFIGIGTLALWAIPTMFVAVVMQNYLSNEDYLQWFPTQGLHDDLAGEMLFLPIWNEQGFQRGYVLDMLWHVVLPVIGLSYTSLAFLTKLTRSSILENLSKDYVRTAKAKGVSSQDILYKHVFRNSILPLITAAASIIPGLLVGSIIIETIFDIPGMGQLTVRASQNNDGPLVLAVTVMSGILGLFSYIIADVCYAIADPRVSYE